MVWNTLRLFRPLLFQGPAKKAPYFEGWYFKHVSAGNGPHRTLSVIPGISRSASGDSAFVQAIYGPAGASRVYSYPIEAFSFSDEPFGIRVGGNRFTLEGATLDLRDEGSRIEGALKYSDAVAPRASLFSPGVMGPYGFAPFLECYHGIASLDHEVSGDVEIGGDLVRFRGGKGYIEKDWGRSMPSSWIWVQSNDFPQTVGRASFSLSLARVPWRSTSFNGFICVLWFGGTEYRFATYTGARIDLLESDGKATRILLSDKTHKLEILLRERGARKSDKGSAPWGSELAAPVEGAMARTIHEYLDSHLRVVLKRRHGSAEDIVLDISTAVATAEIAGDVSELAP